MATYRPAQGVTYLDHAATSPMRESAKQTMMEYMDLVGNPSALHRAGQRARRILEQAREELAAAVGAHPTSVIFTSGGSEANSLAVAGSLLARQRRHQVVIGGIEHPSVLGMRERGAKVAPVTKLGAVDTQALADLLNHDVAVVSIMQVNNETGLIQPVDRVVELAAQHSVWVHTDAVQALGHVPVDFTASGVDLMSLAAHKVGGPVGIGALLARRGVEPRELGLGGGQERGIRSGTSAVALAAGFAAAAREAVAEIDSEVARLGALQNRIVQLVTSCGGRVNTVLGPHTPHIVNVTFPGVRAADILFLLDVAGISASVGSACRAGVHQPSEVLLAMGASADDAASTIRFSLGHSSTETDVDELERVLPSVVSQATIAGKS